MCFGVGMRVCCRFSTSVSVCQAGLVCLTVCWSVYMILLFFRFVVVSVSLCWNILECELICVCV